MTVPIRSGYEVFIAGETLDLVIPNRQAIERDRWHSWFNDPEVVKYTNHGLWPNTPENQEAFLEAALSPNSDRFVLLILPKDADSTVGVVSLSGIDLRHRTAQIAMILGSGPRGKGGMFHGLEAKARMTEHGFTTLGLESVWSAQVRPLAKWQRFQALFGFQVDGIRRKAFRRGQDVHDLVITSCLLEDYQDIVRTRPYWPGKALVFDLMRELPEESPVDVVDAAISDSNARYLSGSAAGGQSQRK